MTKEIRIKKYIKNNEGKSSRKVKGAFVQLSFGMVLISYRGLREWNEGVWLSSKLIK